MVTPPVLHQFTASLQLMFYLRTNSNYILLLDVVTKYTPKMLFARVLIRFSKTQNGGSFIFAAQKINRRFLDLTAGLSFWKISV